jgi:hypothetical protein
LSHGCLELALQALVIAARRILGENRWRESQKRETQDAESSHHDSRILAFADKLDLSGK